MPGFGGNQPVPTRPAYQGGGYGGPVAPPRPVMPAMPSAPTPPVNVNIPTGPAPAPAAAPPVAAAPQIQAPQINIPSQAAHVAAPNPDLADALARVRARLDRPTDTTAEVNQLGQQVAQFANGQRNTATGNAARRGVLGVAGAEGQISDDIGNVAAGTFAKGAADINLARKRDDDQFLLGSMGAFAEPGRQNLADRSLGVQAAGQQGQLALGAGRMNLDAQIQNANMAQQANQMNFQQQLAAQEAARQAQAMQLQIWQNLYR